MDKQIAVDEALTTLKEIRGIINKAQDSVNPDQEKRRLYIALIIQISALAFASIFWIQERFGQVTRDFARSALDSDFRIQGLISLACGLFFLVAALYSLIRLEAKNYDENLQDYISRNFPALLALNFFSDLLVKYAAITAVVLALKPEFVAPLLLVFLADYLLQRRFFILPFKINLIAAIALIGFAIVQLKNGDPSLSYALSAFCALCIGSAINIASRLLSLKSQKGVSHE